MSVKIVRALKIVGWTCCVLFSSLKAGKLHDLHLATRLPKATLLRILKTLIGRDFVWQRIADGAYVPKLYVFQTSKSF